MVCMNQHIQRVQMFYDANDQIPVLEASPDETQVMRFKLVTLPKNTTRIPKVSFGIPNITVSQDEGEVCTNTNYFTKW